MENEFVYSLHPNRRMPVISRASAALIRAVAASKTWGEFAASCSVRWASFRRRLGKEGMVPNGQRFLPTTPFDFFDEELWARAKSLLVWAPYLNASRALSVLAGRYVHSPIVNRHFSHSGGGGIGGDLPADTHFHVLDEEKLEELRVFLRRRRIRVHFVRDEEAIDLVERTEETWTPQSRGIW